jgi:transglutaminase-like putative cysteine protease
LIRARFAAAGLALALPALAAEPSRTFTFVYEARVGPIEAGRGPVHVWVPLAREDGLQRVVAERIEASLPGGIETEDRYGNRFWHGRLPRSEGHPLRVRIETTVERRVHRRSHPATSVGLRESEREAFALFLGPNERVAVGDPILDPIRAEVRERAGSRDPAATARAIYDWVVDNVEYKKVGTGWGNGDTFWACSERYGNCTDFHALFTSLARSEGIPARFEIGFPVPAERAAGEIGGYHCWVRFHLPETGWFPIDASEAFKHPEKRQLFYGTQPADRIHFTTGRDLRLGDDHLDRPLNYFVYPYVEVGGRAWRDEIDRSFAFREREPGTPIAAESPTTPGESAGSE